MRRLWYGLCGSECAVRARLSKRPREPAIPATSCCKHDSSSVRSAYPDSRGES
jgi:hypothetical protein